MKKPFFRSSSGHPRALPEQQKPVLASNPVPEPTEVHTKIQRIRVLLAFLKRDFEAVDSMPWTLFKQRVDPLIEEIEGLLGGLHRQAPYTVLGPLHDQLQMYIRARLRGPTLLPHNNQES